MNRNQIVIKLMWLVGLITAVFIPAYTLVTLFWPAIAAWVIYLDIATIIIFPISYWLIKRFGAKSERWPYFIFHFDLILPVIPYFLIVFALIAPLPQFATFIWGEPTNGTVLDLQTELSTDTDRSYRVTTAYFTTAGGEWTKDIYIGRRLYDTLSIDDTITLHYLPAFPQRAIIADPFLMQTQARLLLWCVFIMSGWLVGVWQRTTNFYS